MSYRIGEVAKLVGMSVEGLRFYERRGLVRPSARTASRYRLYGDPEVRALFFVKAAQEMGFALNEIKALLEIRQGSGDSCVAARDLLAAKLDAVRHRIELLKELERDLAASVSRCDEQIGRGKGDECPVIDEWRSGL